jgi:hypothetical protein
VKFHLLVAASALVVGLGINGAFAGGHDDHGHDGQDPSTSVGVAVALSNQDGGVALNFAKGTVGTNTIGTVGGTGLVNIQQNNGANSILQDQNTLGAILNCSCSSSDQTLGVSLAASNQSALVLGNVSIGATNTTNSGAEQSSGAFFAAGSSSSGDDSHGHDSHDNHGHDDGSKKFAAGGAFAQAANWSKSSTAVGSSNTLSSFSGTGLYNISQNNGNNSMLQSGNTVAAIVGR